MHRTYICNVVTKDAEVALLHFEELPQSGLIATCTSSTRLLAGRRYKSIAASKMGDCNSIQCIMREEDIASEVLWPLAYTIK